MRALTSAFTLIELLVVITIIVVLLALLTPALDKAVEQAQRAVCGGNMHLWGAAHSQFFLDHQRKILSVPYLRKGVAQGLHPNHARYRRTSGVEAGDFNLDDIAPYVQGANDGPWGNATHVGKAWYCPSSKDNYFQAGIADEQARTRAPNDPLSDELSFMYNDYAYFGMAGSRNPGQVTSPEKVSDRSMGEGRLLMSETVFRFNPPGVQWWFNHSPLGYSMHFNTGRGDYVHNGPPPQIGVNQLFADGSAAWKGEGYFDPAEMYPAVNPKKIDFVSANTNPNLTEPDAGSNLNLF